MLQKQKKLLSFFGASLVSVALISQSAIANTPDGETPAEEAVCDVLMEDGVTKGLYGLCVAYCEAQDHVMDSAGVPVVNENLLRNYDRRKQASDPDMPCLGPGFEEEACPAWSLDELQQMIDLQSNPGVSDFVQVDASNRRYEIVTSISNTDINSTPTNRYSYSLSTGRYTTDPSGYYRALVAFVNYDESWNITSRTFRGTVFMSEEEYNSCKEEIVYAAEQRGSL